MKDLPQEKQNEAKNPPPNLDDVLLVPRDVHELLELDHVVRLVGEVVLLYDVPAAVRQERQNNTLPGVRVLVQHADTVTPFIPGAFVLLYV